MKAEDLKNAITKNFGIKILALLLGLVVWAVIITVDDPVKSATIYNVPVSLLNEETLETQDKVFEVVRGDTVNIYVNGKRSVINALKASDFTATADLDNLYYDLVEIQVVCKVANVEIKGMSTNYVKISLEDVVTKEFRVTVETTGTPEDGYAIGSVKASPNFIEVTGPQSQIDQIDEMRAYLSASNVSKDFTTTLTVKPYNSSGEALDQSKLKFQTEVVATATVLSTKVVPIKVTTKGTPAAGFEAQTAVCDPTTVEIEGKDSALADVSNITVEVDITGASSNVEVTENLTDYLPDGITLTEPDATVSVKIPLGAQATQQLDLDLSDVTVENVADNLDYSLDANTRVTVTVQGLTENLQTVTSSSLGAYIDAKDLAAGGHTVPVQFKTQDGISVISSTTVYLILTEKGSGTTTEPGTTEPGTTETTPGGQDNSGTAGQTGGT